MRGRWIGSATALVAAVAVTVWGTVALGAAPPAIEASGSAPAFPAPPTAPAPFAAGPRHEASSAGMVRLPAGSYRPLYGPENVRLPVERFELDRYPVTRAEYARFMEDHPEWRPDGRAGKAAGAGYLAGESPNPDRGDANRPVTGVPLAAADAYCVAQGKRLPTTDEWEYAAAASEARKDASGDAAFQQRLLELYTRPRRSVPAPVGSTFRNAFGVYDLHGLVWEWTVAARAPEAGMHMEHAAMAAGDTGNHEHHAMAAGRVAAHHDLGCAGSAIGATDTRAYAAFLRYAFRGGLTASTTLPTLGFRCAR